MSQKPVSCVLEGSEDDTKSMSESPKKRTIAVVGGGIAGLTSARLLCAEHDVTVYERSSKLGGHSNTIAVDDPRGERWVDTGFIVYNDRNYPNFERLLAELGVATEPSKMGMSMSNSDASFEFAYTRKGMFAQRSNILQPRFYRLIADFLRFTREIKPLAGRADAPTIGEFMRDSGYSEWFIDRVMIPQVSGVWSTGTEDSADFPIGFLAEFLHNHGQLDLFRRPRWRTISGGSRNYVAALANSISARKLTSAPVSRIERRPDGVAIHAEGREVETYDEVVIAAHSDQALAMLADPTPQERAALGAISYQPNETVLHSDVSVMPRRRAAWSSWNFHLSERPIDGTAITYWMNNLQTLDAERDYFVTLNRTDQIDPAKICEVIDYSHPVISHAAVAAQKRWDQISGADRIHYAGAYWRWGFHEDGCWSALRACQKLLEAQVEPLELPVAA